MSPYSRLIAFYFFYYAFFGIHTPYFSLFLQHRGFGAAQIGLLTSIYQFTRVFAPNVSGWVADRTGKRLQVVKISACMTLLGYALVMPSHSVPAMALALGLAGFFWSCQQPLTEALTLAHLRDEPWRYGGVRAWGSFGFIVLVLGMGWWLERNSINSVYWGTMGLLAITLFFAWMLPEIKIAPARREAHTGGVLAILRQREVMGVFAACMLMTAAHGTLNVFYSIHLSAAGYSKSVIGVMWTLGVIVEIIVMMLSPRLLARFPVHWIFSFAFVCAIVRFLVIGWCAAWPVVMALAQCMHGITFGACHVSAISVVHRRFGEQHQGQGQAFYGSICSGLGGIIGAALSGAMWDRLGAGWSFSFSSALALLAFIVYWQIARPRAAASA